MSWEISVVMATLLQSLRNNNPSSPSAQNGFLANRPKYDFSEADSADSEECHDDYVHGNSEAIAFASEEPNYVFSLASSMILLPLVTLLLHYYKKKKILPEEEITNRPAKKKVRDEQRCTNKTPLKESYDAMKYEAICAPSVELLGEIVVGKVSKAQIGFFSYSCSRTSLHLHCSTKGCEAEEPIAMAEVVTPLRRSARLRSRRTMIASP